MSDTSVRVVFWDSATPPPSEQEAEARLRKEGYVSFRWHDVPGAAYPRHRHDHDECLWILDGKIVFSFEGQTHVLNPGDRLYLPAKAPHTAKIPGPGGCTYLVGQRRS